MKRFVTSAPHVLRLAMACITIGAPLSTQAQEPVAEVNPFIGEDWFGEVFVGASVPFGMVKLGPDLRDYGHRKGFQSTGDVRGFSHLHLSGGSGKYDNLRVAPSTGELQPTDIHSPRDNEQASPGYYATDLTRYHVKAELTATRRVGMQRYTFADAGEAHITMDLDLLDKSTGAESQRFLGGEITVLSPHEIVGVGRYIGGWNEGGEYAVYFDMITDTPAKATRTWTGNQLSEASQAHVEHGQPIGASLDYQVTAGQAIQAKVGISFVSPVQAHRNLTQEIDGWDFDAVHQAAVTQWNQALGRIQIQGASDVERRMFYTALFHTMMMPSDHTGENPKWTSKEPYYDDFQAIWDTFRSQGPLLTLIAPDRQRDIVRSLIDTYRHAGYMPDARVGNDNGRTQGGSNADVLVADAYVKGLKGIDYATGFQAMLKDAQVAPADARKEGRGGLDTYNTLGYVAQPTERAGSRTVEYAYDDFAIAELACGLGHAQEAKRYSQHAGNWANLWDATQVQEGINGFLRPRNADGSWAPQYLVRRGTWPDFYYEGDLWTYSLYAPQDVRKLVAMSGGDEAFVHRLDTTFDNLHFDVTNEPGFLLPDLYLWAGRPDRTADRVSNFLHKAFNETRGGIPGNDDSGAMSSWYAFQSMGFYPNAGQDVYLIGTPSFPQADIDLGHGKHFKIIAENLSPDHLNRYVQSATLNGKPLEQAWFRHGDIANGATLHLVMGPHPSSWGTHTPPPSMSDADFSLCKR
ncbi:MAG: GH92 family glycosyl hydrolase [Dyella sp.]